MSVNHRIKYLLSIFLLIISLICIIFSFTLSSILAKADEVSNSSQTQAYFIRDDFQTMGAWYAGNGDGQNPDNRYYGKSGAILMYHLSAPDGKTYTSSEDVNNFKDNSDWTSQDGTINPEGSKVHYVELPDWINSVTGNIGDSGADIPHDYWNCSQLTLDEILNMKVGMYEMGRLKHLMPVNEERLIAEAEKYPTRISNTQKIYFANGQCGSPLQYDIDVNDDEWHLVTIYTGNYWPNKYNGFDGFTSYLCIKDPQGNVVAEHIVENFYQTVNVTFAVKGDFTIYEDNSSGAKSETCIMSIYFDELPDLSDDIGVSNLQVTRDGPKETVLTWNNTSSDQLTSVYRREKGAGDNAWTKIVELGAGVQSYRDTTTNVSTTYEYTLASGLQRVDSVGNKYEIEVDVADFLLPDASQIVEISTAPYKSTMIVLNKALYDVAAGEELKVNATLYKETEDGEYVLYEGIDVKLTLSGDSVYIPGSDIATMETDLGTVKTTKTGVARFSYSQIYPGTYTITASIEVQPDPNNPDEYGYDACSASATFVQRDEQEEVSPPILANISEAILPGETVTITGYNLSVDAGFQIAYAPNSGKEPGVFDETNIPNNCKYLDIEDILVSDDMYGSGLMFMFPQTEDPGTYDFWVKNSGGWSNGITLNGVKPQYLSQEAAYPGLPIEIVGRNFFRSEYGVGTVSEALASIKVKLVSVTDPTKSYITSVLDGVRYTSDQSVTGKVVYHSNPYRITFITPAVEVYGEYKVYVAADGVDYRKTDVAQTFEIVPKKAAAWDETVFGPIAGSSHIGNDPLDLQVYWAQDFNYNNIKTINSNKLEFENAVNDLILKNDANENVLLGQLATVTNLSESVISAVKELSQQGGGVLYFPEGDYYLRGMNFGDYIENVILVGAGINKTRIHFVNSRVGTEYFFQFGAQLDSYGEPTGSNNIGFAHMSFDRYTFASLSNTNFTVYTADPDVILYMGSVSSTENIADYKTYNKFVTDCSFNFNGQKENGKRAIATISGGEKNILLQNLYIDGCATLQWGRSYEYQTFRNIYMDCTAYSSATMGLAKFMFMENLYVDNNYDGHGLKAGAYSYIGNCAVYRTGARGADAVNNGEAIMFEPPTGYFSVGSILSADARSFTYARQYGKDIDNSTRMDTGDLAVYIIEGKGAGQMRYIDRVSSGEYNNIYQFSDGEEDWDVLPDTTSKVTLICPNIGNTVYSVYIEDTLKPILLYGCCFDMIVADCTLKNSEGIAVTATSIPKDGRFTPNGNIRIENNTITGVSPVTGYAGIYVQSSRTGDYYGMQTYGVTIRNNTLKDIQPDPNAAYKPGASEVTHMSGIIIQGNSTTDVSQKTDIRFITIENNIVDNCAEYGIYCSNRITGVVIHNNTISDVGTDETLTVYSPVAISVIAYHTLYVNGEESELSGEYTMGAELPVLQAENGKAFVGWSTSADYQTGDPLTQVALGNNTTLYAIFGNSVKLLYNYQRQDGTDAGVFYEFNVSDGESIEDRIASYGNPFRVGYTFAGWYVDPECTTIYDFSKSVTGNLTLYAKWSGANSIDTNDQSPTENGGCNGVILAVSITAAIAICGIVTTALIVRARQK